MGENYGLIGNLFNGNPWMKKEDFKNIANILKQKQQTSLTGKLKDPMY